MIETIAVIVAMLFFFGLVTLGMVLLVAFFAERQPRGRKVLLAAIGGPGSFLLLTTPFALLDAPTWEALLGLAIILLFASVIVGWPIAYFATRRLERLMRFDTSTFE